MFVPSMLVAGLTPAPDRPTRLLAFDDQQWLAVRFFVPCLPARVVLRHCPSPTGQWPNQQLVRDGSVAPLLGQMPIS